MLVPSVRRGSLPLRTLWLLPASSWWCGGRRRLTLLLPVSLALWERAAGRRRLWSEGGVLGRPTVNTCSMLEKPGAQIDAERALPTPRCGSDILMLGTGGRRRGAGGAVPPTATHRATVCPPSRPANYTSSNLYGCANLLKTPCVYIDCYFLYTDK